MLLDANKIENVKFVLNKGVAPTLSDASTFAQQKARVIQAWETWNNGDILSDQFIRKKFSAYFGVAISSNASFKNALIQNDNWFNIMFKNNGI